MLSKISKLSLKGYESFIICRIVWLPLTAILPFRCIYFFDEMTEPLLLKIITTLVCFIPVFILAWFTFRLTVKRGGLRLSLQKPSEHDDIWIVVGIIFWLIQLSKLTGLMD